MMAVWPLCSCVSLVCVYVCVCVCVCMYVFLEAGGKY